MGEVDGAGVKWRWLVPTPRDWVVCVLYALVTIALNLWASAKNRDYFEKEAVSAGAARYVFDEAGDPHFEWRKP